MTITGVTEDLNAKFRMKIKEESILNNDYIF